MRGLDGFNYATFNDVEEAIHKWSATLTAEPLTVINPARNFDGDTTLPIATYMQQDLEQVLSVDALVLLPGWKDSEGAKLEVRVALVTGKRFYEAVAYRVASDNPLGNGTVEWSFNEISGPLEREPDGNASPRSAVLAEASKLITGDRNSAYGEPSQDFTRSAGAANAYGYRGPDGRPLQAHDIALLISLVKISRLMWRPDHRDSWVDLAGYAGCGYECTTQTA